MRVDEVISELERGMSSLGVSIFQRNDKRIYVDVPPEHTLAANRYVFEQMGGRLATATGMDTPSSRIEVLYHYCLDKDGMVLTLRTWTERPDCELDSVTTIIPGAGFIEREIQDLLGVRFRNHPDPRRLILADNWPEGVYPLRRDFKARPRRKETAEFLREATGEVVTP